MVDIRQTEAYANYLKSLGWTVERIGEINYFIRKIPLLGSILKIQRPQELRFNTINKLSHIYRVFQIILEPNLSSITETGNGYNLLLSRGFKRGKSSFLPTKTLQIDLTKPKNEILKRFKKDARQSIKRGERLIIKKYSTPSEIKIFREGWKNCVKFKRFVPSSGQLINLRKNFPDNHSLFLASHNIAGSIIGGVIFTTSFHETSNHITYYWQAFSNTEGRSTLSSYSLLWQGILWAKSNGSMVLDFEGIYDPRFPNKSWQGFTHFKRSFGGYEIEYPGMYVKFRLPW